MKAMAAKTKIAVFGLTGCEGCEFHLLSLNELLLDVFQDFEVVNWRLLMKEEKRDFDIAFIEGAVTTAEQIRLLKKIRETSKIVVALGTCALSGNFFARLTPQQRRKLAGEIYDCNYQLKAKFLAPVEKFIRVDEKIAGCPPPVERFKNLLTKFKKQKIVSKIEKVTPPDYVARIEGHGQLKINFKQKRAEFEAEEGERLVEGLLLGKNYQQAPVIVSRICGICPIAHNLCSWKAIENALRVDVPKQTVALREILLCAQIIKSHLLHLFFLVLPGLAGLGGSIELAEKYPAEFHLMLNIKRVGDKILNLIGGGTPFPTRTVLGGFLQPLKMDELLSLRDDIEEVVDEAEDLINLLASFKVLPMEIKTAFLTTSPPVGRYPLYQSQIVPRIKEIVNHHSTAKQGVLESGRVIKVGALARLAQFAQFLNPKAKQALAKHKFSFTNPFYNNLAQAIEILHFLEEARRLVEGLIGQNLTNVRPISPDFSVRLRKGEACLEAPRGVLIHQVCLGKDGRIENYNIIPPTQINLASLAKEAQWLVEKELGKPEKIQREIKGLIRAFDPCITCAVH